jgi:uroporphyrinogen decarboxylase
MDRVPANYLGTPEVDAALRAHFALGPAAPRRPGEITDGDWDIQARLGTDLRCLRLPYTGPPIPTFDDGRVQNIFGVIRKPIRNEAGVYMESCHSPYAAFETAADVDAFPWPDPSWFDYSVLAPQCRDLRDYAIVYGWPGNLDLINGTSFGRGFEQAIVDMATEDPAGMRIMERRFEFWHEQNRLALAAAGGAIDIVWIGDDFGTQRGLLLSPAKWRKLFRPKLRAMIDLAHRYGARLMLHSCGATRPLWPDLVDIGLDIYDTVQPEAAGMVAEELAAEFGQHICLHGTISTQRVLPHGSPEDVAAQVRQRIESFGSRGGLIVAPSHNIQPDTPLENVLAMYRAVGCLE